MKLPAIWTAESYSLFQKELFQFEDLKYKEFNLKLITTNYKKIGIRMPILKKIAKQISKQNPLEFLKVAKNIYYEEVMIQGLVIATLDQVDEILSFLDSYIQKIDNWALCDSFVTHLKIVSNYPDLFLEKIKQYIKSKNEYEVRVGFVLLLNYYIDDKNLDQIFNFCNQNSLNTYYVKMAKAWLISQCFIQYKEKTLSFLKTNHLDSFTQNRAISKIRDSYRVSKEDKDRVLKYKK